MKPFQIIVLVIFGVAALVGLYLFATYSGIGGNRDEVGQVTIWGTLPAATMQEAVSRLATSQKIYAGVQYVEVPSATFEAQLAEAIASGSGPDLIVITQEQLVSQKSKLTPFPYSAISERAFVNAYVAEAELFLEEDGVYGLPLAVDPLMLYYNRAHLSAAAIAQPPATWEAVTGVAGKLTRIEGDQDIERSAIALGEYTNVTNARAILSLLLLQSGTTITEETPQGGVRSTLVRAGGDTLGTPLADSALAFYTQFANPAKTVYSWNRSLPLSQQAFLAGDLALYLGFASERLYFSAANPNLDFDLAPVPQSALATARSTYGLVYAVALPKVTDNFAGAYQAAFALTDPSQAPVTAQELGMAPARRASLAAPPDDRFSPVIYPEALVARGWLSPTPFSTDAVFAGMISNVTSGRQGTVQALTTADQALNAALR